MKQLLSLFAFLPLFLSAQYFDGRELVLEEVTVPGMPALQSFAWGQHDGQWFIIGGRTDGLHRRQPPFAFLATGNNLSAYVVDPVTQQVWSAPISALPQSMEEQLQSTNMEFEQRDSTLYCAGGYGYSPTALDHITYPNLTAIDLAGVMDAIRNSQPIAPFFRQLTDPRMEVTGGQMRLLDDRFYLVGGQRFIGRYNPMGPNQGPGFIQEYTNAVRRFAIDDDGVSLAINDYWELVDTMNLHRRDYNMLPQIFPNGEEGFTAFTGVFQYVDDIPWLNTLDVIDTNVTVVPVFEQLLNQYHSAHVGLYDANSNAMRSVFFGGIGRYYFDGNGTLMDDINVPFVNTISVVQRDGQGVLIEAQVGTMPALLGASAEFVPWPGTPQNASGIMLQQMFVGDTIVLGHVVGGIESTAGNIFFINTGVQSEASSRIFRVLLVDPAQSILVPDGAAVDIRLRREGDVLHVSIGADMTGAYSIRLLDTVGRAVQVLAEHAKGAERSFEVDLQQLAPGAYMVEVRHGQRVFTARFIR
ncbi:MAG: T9SS type A sorting domain-containing protein [Flavobacteriales bacterium]|nr:T9SS type A sorting domain-containing protein [Flavobacteriales bacterium]